MGNYFKCGCCESVQRGYRIIDSLYEVDEIGMVVDFVFNITNMSMDRAVEIVKKHAAVEPYFYVIEPDIADDLMTEGMLTLVNFLKEKFQVKNVSVLPRGSLENNTDRSKRNVVFHLHKAPHVIGNNCIAEL